MGKPMRVLRSEGQQMMQQGARQPQPHSKFEGLGPEPPPPAIDMPTAAIEEEEAPEYIDTTTGKKAKGQPKPCCGCRTCDFRFPLEMDEETTRVYREAKYCGLSYTFISSWCLMLFFGTIASGGIVAVGFLDAKLLQYQIIGIVLAIIFGIALPVFFVFWICIKMQEKEIRRNYRSMKNREQVYNEEKTDLTNNEKKKKVEEEKKGEEEGKKDDVSVDMENPKTPDDDDVQLLIDNM